MTPDQLANSVVEYATTVMAPKAKDWRTKFAIGFGAYSYRQRIIDAVSGIGCVNKDGSVDVNKLKCSVMAGFSAAGKVELLDGMIGLDISDAEDMFRFIGA